MHVIHHTLGCLRGLLVATSLCTAPIAAEVITVSQDGSADFTNVTAALAAAQSGDVLVLAQGTYEEADLTIDKDLTILGESGGTPPILEMEVTVVGSTRLTVSGMHITGLTAEDVDRRLRIDDCQLKNLDLRNCTEALVTDTSVLFGIDTVWISLGSTAVLAGCRILGGSVDAFGTIDASGSNSIIVLDASRVVVAGCNVAGATPDVVFPAVGNGGRAILASGDSMVSVRGSSFHAITGGQGVNGGPDGEALLGSGIQYSGVTVQGPAASSLLVDPPQPYLSSTPAILGATSAIELFGPAGQPALAFASIGAVAPFSVPGWGGGLLWSNLASLTAVVGVSLAGQDVPATIETGVPDEVLLLGSVVDLQAIVLMADGSLQLTNPSQLIPRP